MIEPRNHQLVNVGLTCLVCGFKGASCFHGEINELVGISAECSHCHNYIVYEDKGKLLKDEIYLDGDYWIIRNFEDGECHIFSNDIPFNGIKIPMFENSEIPSLKNKIELFITFS